MKLYHNARCSKSRGALELLQARGHAPEIVAYLCLQGLFERGLSAGAIK